MRKLLAVTLTAVVAVACADTAPTAPDVEALDLPGISAAANPAITQTTNEFIPLALTLFVPCAADGAGEFVDMEGPLHHLSHVTIKGDHLTLKTHDQPQGISGYGQTTGDKYQGTGVTQQTWNWNGVSYPFTTTFVNNFRIIGQGPGNNLLLHNNQHVTINANGDVTTVVDNFRVECK